MSEESVIYQGKPLVPTTPALATEALLSPLEASALFAAPARIPPPTGKQLRASSSGSPGGMKFSKMNLRPSATSPGAFQRLSKLHRPSSGHEAEPGGHLFRA